MDFLNDDVKAKFQPVPTTDRDIHLINIKWAGKLSEITLTVAEELINQGATDLIKPKQASDAKAASTKDPKDKQ